MFVRELTKTYDGAPVVNGVTFEIHKGKLLSLIGPNGAGKSTVMGMLSRLVAKDAGLVDLRAGIWGNGRDGSCPSGWPA